MNRSATNEDYLIFCDFDGTIAEVDVGYRMLSAFSTVGNDDLKELWNTRKIGARECLLIEAERIASTREQMLTYVDQFAIDKDFVRFVKFIELKKQSMTVLSDGLDFYIQHILNNHNVGHLEVHTNHAIFDGSSLKVEFPYNDGCGVCGSCKAERIRTIKARENFQGQIVFIGDGYSDICAIPETDLLFAKGDLHQYCLSEKIEHTAFENFGEIGKALFADWK